jgi:type IV pilus assembly protein PilA
VGAAAGAWNNGFQATKYVSNVGVATNGVITVTYGAATTQISGNTLILAPYINGVALASVDAANSAGNIDWGCASQSNTTAVSRSMTGMPTGTILARYVPTECK